MNATAKEKLITVTGLKKQFGGVPVLCGIDVEIDRGDVICVIGPFSAASTCSKNQTAVRSSSRATS